MNEVKNKSRGSEMDKHRIKHRYRCRFDIEIGIFVVTVMGEC